MSAPDPSCYSLLKRELRRIDPQNPRLAFVEQIEAEMRDAAIDRLSRPWWRRIISRG